MLDIKTFNTYIHEKRIAFDPSVRFRRKIFDLPTILGGICNSTHSRYWNYQREERLNLEIHDFLKGVAFEGRDRTRNSCFRHVKGEGRKSRLLGGFHGKLAPLFSPTFIFRNSRARHSHDTVVVKAISPQISCRGCIFLPIYSGQPISLPDFTRPLPERRIYEETSQCVRVTCSLI